MNLNTLYSLITESSAPESELVKKLVALHRKVRMAFTRVYKLHLHSDMISRSLYKEKLKNSWAKAMQLQREYLDFIEKHKHDILMSSVATQKIKEFRDRNPFIFSNK